MRTASPFVTCSSTQDCGPSATPGSISRPRIIGPGCRTSAPGFASCRRSGVSWYPRMYSSAASAGSGMRSVCRPTQSDLRVEFAEQVNVRARYAAMQDVAEYRYVEAVELAGAVANRQRIEQRLCGMLVRSVARIQHGNFQALRDEIRGARCGVAHHDSVGAHRFERAHRIDQRFALLQARRFGLQIHLIGAEARSSCRKADSRARGSFEKSQRYRLAAQRRQFFQRMPLKFLEGRCLIENKSDLLAGEGFNSEQVFQSLQHCFPLAECLRNDYDCADLR